MSQEVTKMIDSCRQLAIRFAIVTVAVVSGILALAPMADAYTSPAIWVGSPVPGSWGVPGDWSTTPGGGHHHLVKASPQADWAGDLPTNAGTAVYLYVAPSNSAYNDSVTARVSQIVDGNACANGGGADFVNVAIYYNGSLYGQALYAHINRDPSLYIGKPIARWGTYLGSVAYLSGSATGGSSCWTGPHVHFEMEAFTQYACWNRGYSYAGYPISPTNFLGFVSGPLATYPTACP
jgi:hypothetical protein